MQEKAFIFRLLIAFFASNHSKFFRSFLCQFLISNPSLTELIFNNYLKTEEKPDTKFYIFLLSFLEMELKEHKPQSRKYNSNVERFRLQIQKPIITKHQVERTLRILGEK